MKSEQEIREELERVERARQKLEERGEQAEAESMMSYIHALIWVLDGIDTSEFPDQDALDKGADRN